MDRKAGSFKSGLESGGGANATKYAYGRMIWYELCRMCMKTNSHVLIIQTILIQCIRKIINNLNSIFFNDNKLPRMKKKMHFNVETTLLHPVST